MRRRVGQERLLRVETRVLVGVGEFRPADLGDLVTQEIDLASPGAFVAAESSESRIDLGETTASLSQRGEIDTAEPVEGADVDCNSADALEAFVPPKQ